jgi:D-glycero-D-manno-heptose 1,7-bisphosphate phosphatase
MTSYGRALKKTVFLDRDGTIIIDKIYLNDPDQIEYLPGVFEALCRLRDNGYQFIVVTNQSGIARGIVSVDNLNETHRRIRAAFVEHGVEFKEFYYAPYSVESDHPMRKPHPGMLLQGAKDFDVDLAQSWMIGDRLSDVIAGSRAGCQTILLSGVEVPDPTGPKEAQPTAMVDSLLEAANRILISDK